MVPETIQIHQSRGAGGILSTLFHHSASLKGAVKRGQMPPLRVFNDFMQCGIDDIDEDSTPCVCIHKRMSAGRAVLLWKPFRLTPAEYRGFLRQLRKAGRRFRVTDYRTSSFEAWWKTCFSR